MPQKPQQQLLLFLTVFDIEEIVMYNLYKKMQGPSEITMWSYI